MGSVPLSRHSFRQRHAYAWLSLQAVAGSQGDRRRSVDPRLCEGNGRRIRGRQAHPLQSPRQEGVVVERGRMLDRRSRTQGYGRDGPLHLQLPLHELRILQLSRRLHARVQGHRELQGQDRSSAEVAVRPRLQGQERRRDRFRRDGDDAGALDGQGCRPYHHVAAVADLCRVASGQGRGRQRDAIVPSGTLGLCADAVEERDAAAVHVSPDAHKSGEGEEDAHRHGQEGTRPGLRRRDALHAEIQSVGPAPVPCSQQRSVRRHPVRQGRRS